MDIYARDLVKSGPGIIGSPVIAGYPTPQIPLHTYYLDPEGKGVLICKLRRGQELRIKCIAKKVTPPET